jgi:carbonic anhydrase
MPRIAQPEDALQHTRMQDLGHLFEKNRAWADGHRARDPQFFEALSRHQAPELLWIGCSDSRVAPSRLLDLPPGELFVHRNVGNVVSQTDPNCLAAVQYAVDVLKVKHVIVCGHSGCGAVQAVLDGTTLGPADEWLSHVRDVRDKHKAHLATLPDEEQRVGHLCELNALEQALNVCRTSALQAAWSRGQSLRVHSWIYRMADGLLQDLELSVSGPDDVEASYHEAVRRTAAPA